tara:strand:- start:360 stop:536 length:177 start_codon:yes stop_codon:yes gene_type:complete
MTQAYPLAYSLTVEGVISKEIVIVADSLENAERIAKEEFINEFKGDNAVVIFQGVHKP